MGSKGITLRHGDLRDDRPAVGDRVDVRLQQPVGEPLPAPGRRDPERDDLCRLAGVGGQRDHGADDEFTIDRRRDAEAGVAQAGRDQRAGAGRVRDGKDAPSERQARPRRRVHVGDDRRRLPGCGVIRRLGWRHGTKRIPPASVPSRPQESRHGHPSNEPGHGHGSFVRGHLRGIEWFARVREVGERLGRWRLAVSGAFAGPPIAPCLRRQRRHLAMGTGQPDEAPGSRDHPVRVVPAAAGRKPPATGIPVRDRVHQSCRGAHRGCRHVEVGERVPGVRVGAVLRHDHIRSEGSCELGNERLDDRQPRPFAGVGLERHVDRGSGRHPDAQLPHPAGPRKQVAASLVDRDCHHARVVCVDRLDAVTVMDVEVEIEDAQTGRPSTSDRQRWIVVDAEARSAIAHGVVQPAAWMEGMLHVAADDRVHRPDGAARHGRRRVVHAGEGRVVTTLADPGLGPAVGRVREALDGLDVASGM